MNEREEEPGRDAAPGEGEEVGDELTVSSLRGPATAPRASGKRRAPGRWRRWYRAGGAVTLAALLVAGALVWFRPTLFRPPPPPLDHVALDADPATLGCAESASWSPDNRRIAALERFNCTNGRASSVQLSTYDAQTGRRLSTVPLDAAISAVAPGPTAPPFAQEALWSPDGQTIAVQFALDATGATPAEQPRQGLILVTHGQPKAFLAPAGIAPIAIESDPFEPAPVYRWDVTRGALDTLSVPRVLSYRWGPDDRIEALSLLSTGPNAAAPAAPAGPVGQPLGGREFSMWQRGEIEYSPAENCVQLPTSSGTATAHDAGDEYSASLSTPAWSPDGRYLLVGLSMQGLVAVASATPQASPPSPSAAPNCSRATDRLPRFPLRDAGLRAAFSAMAATFGPSQSGALFSVAWRPDGKRLVVAPTDVVPGGPALTIYDCATGRVRAQIGIDEIDGDAGAPRQGGGRPFQQMVWSPDGTRLLALPQGPNAAPLLLTSAKLGG